MSFIKPQSMDLKYFLGEFHSGLVNRVLHIIGFALLVYGLTQKDLFVLLIVSPLVMESGHLYNHLVLHKYRTKDELIRIVLLQIAAWLLSVGFISLMLKYLKKL